MPPCRCFCGFAGYGFLSSRGSGAFDTPILIVYLTRFPNPISGREPIKPGVFGLISGSAGGFEFLFPSGRRGWKNLLEFLPATYEILLRVAFSEKNEKMFLVFIFV
jgi:hypothetical protein